MAKIEDQKIKKDLINRLRTVKGHIGGIERMLEEDKDCSDILIQISAIKSSVNKIGLSLVENNLCECIFESLENKEEVKDSVKDALKSFLKFTK
ncbi:metal-sensitive transcriptional regulator [Orenia marismortui]|nr:metal-sensitive transcriptional regulator [Orenia marismortui]